MQINNVKFLLIKCLICITVLAFELSKNSKIEAAEVSITLDDFDITDSVYFTAQERNKKLLDVFDRYSIKVALFVTGRNVDSLKGQQLLQEWDNHGHQISNHTYSHLNYSSNEVNFDAFSKDILRSEYLINKFSHFNKFLRFPYLHEGNSQIKITRIRNFGEDGEYEKDPMDRLGL